MELKIYGEIISDTDKSFLLSFLDEVSGVSYADIREALKNVKEGEDVTLRIHCKGGDCIDGFAIYDALRAIPNNISAVVEGECSSMATIILLAAKKENRRAYANTRFCVHEPRYFDFIADQMTVSDAERIAADLMDERDRLVRVYTDRTDMDENTVLDLMKKDKYITAEEAKSYGLISEIIAPVSAKKNNFKQTKSNKPNQMNAIQKAVVALAKAVGVTDIKDEDPKNEVVLKTKEEIDLTVDIPEGDDIKVGDAATPDGVFTLEDGRVVTVEGGVVTDIKAADENQEVEPEQNTTEDNSDTNARLEALEARIKALEDAQTTDEEKSMLQALKNAGGAEALKSLHSGYVAQKRQNTTPQARKSLLQEEMERAGLSAKKN